jgi:hypothetical protein
VQTRPASPDDVFELRITLRYIEPAIWRRVRVPAGATLALLHEIIQIAFGWENCHLHEFEIGDTRFTPPDVRDQLRSADEHAAPLGAVVSVGSRFMYRYDFGDDWDHEIVVERKIAGGDKSIVCTGGARACPPEDCGGPGGYDRLLEVLADPKDEEHAEMKEWVGRGFDPEKFNLAAVNKLLVALSKRLGRGRK